METLGDPRPSYPHLSSVESPRKKVFDQRKRQELGFLTLAEKTLIEQRVSDWMKKNSASSDRERSRSRQPPSQSVIQVLYEFFTCGHNKEHSGSESNKGLSTEEQEREALAEKERQLIALMDQPTEQQLLTRKAKALWRSVRKKRQLIKMMGVLGYQETHKLIKQKALRTQGKGPKVEEDRSHQKPSRFIIHPNNYLLFHWSNLVVLTFIIWIFLTFYEVSLKKTMTQEQVNMLLTFDVIFVIDRWLDLFVGFYQPNGHLEHSILVVVQQNFSLKMVMEIFVSFGQLMVPVKLGLHPVFYTCVKILRYGRLFEIDTQIKEILEYYGRNKTVFEIKQMERLFDILQFTLQTLINLHFLTCSQIVMCKQQTPFSKSWMGGNGIEEDEFMKQYINAIYFVTTTLSTCGFGDISASEHSAIESLVILFLQFVGMLFYSMTIQKMQSFLINDQIQSSEYANFMVEVVENLIVKVGMHLPLDARINGYVINDWKIYSLKYFQYSPNSFLADNEFFNMMSNSLKVKLVKNNIHARFQEQFDTLFIDSEFGFKADDALVASLVSSLQFESQEDEQKPNCIELFSISKKIFFILSGQVEVSYMRSNAPILRFRSGSYFGDISLLFHLKNKFQYIPIREEPSQLFSLKSGYLEDIFTHFPEFRNVLKIRALRRQRYFKKLAYQMEALRTLRLKHAHLLNEPRKDLKPYIVNSLLNSRKARLVEHKMSFEDLQSQKCFSEDELTICQSRESIKVKKETEALLKCRRLEKQVQEMKRFSIESMSTLVNTFSSINENSQKLLYAPFNSEKINLFSNSTPQMVQELLSIQSNFAEPELKPDNSDYFDSEWSGNDSANDEVHKIQSVRKLLIHQEQASDHSESWNSEEYLDQFPGEATQYQRQRHKVKQGVLGLQQLIKQSLTQENRQRKSSVIYDFADPNIAKSESMLVVGGTQMADRDEEATRSVANNIQPLDLSQRQGEIQMESPVLS